MLKNRIVEIMKIKYEKLIMLYDYEKTEDVFTYTDILTESGFEVILYDDIDEFRLLFETKIKGTTKKWAVIVSDEIYIPYDIKECFYPIEMSLKNIFPKLSSEAIMTHLHDLDIISFTYDECYTNISKWDQTEEFINNTVFSQDNILKYCKTVLSNIKTIIDSGNLNYKEWISIAKWKSSVEYFCAKARIELDTSFIELKFKDFIFDGYENLSGQISKESPIILPKVLDFISGDKVALIVMDGMSLFDFEVLSRKFDNIKYEYECIYALVPTTTAISRQSLLSGKYPRQLEKPFSLDREEREFMNAAKELGYSGKQIKYLRGYKLEISPLLKFISIIINDIDDMAHGQKQGRIGMYNDVGLLADSNNLQNLIKKLNNKGFKVYLTSDHGNTLCIGVGSLRSSGVEVETKSKRMVVLKDFADENDIIKNNTFLYPGYYLDKSYKYFICNANKSFDNKNEEVMTHGGISIEEVIVPFIKVKAVQ